MLRDDAASALGVQALRGPREGRRGVPADSVAVRRRVRGARMGAGDRPAGLAMSLSVDDVEERVHARSFLDVVDGNRRNPPEDLEVR